MLKLGSLEYCFSPAAALEVDTFLDMRGEPRNGRTQDDGSVADGWYSVLQDQRWVQRSINRWAVKDKRHPGRLKFEGEFMGAMEEVFEAIGGNNVYVHCISG